MAAPAPRRDAPRAVLLWERLPIVVQIAVVLPLSVLLMYAAHVTLLNQPSDRGMTYGVFWGIVATFVIVGSTRAERSRREARRAADQETPGRMRL